MSEAFDVGSLDWQAVRPDVAYGVFGKSFVASGVKVTLTRVVPGGAFTAHSDEWGHLFFFLGGAGRVRVGDETFDVRADFAVTVPSGVPHSYENTGSGELTLISMNLPA